MRTSVCWMFFARRWRRRGIRGCWRSNASGGIGAGRGKKEVRKRRGKDSRDGASLNRLGRKEKEFNTEDTETAEGTGKKRTGRGRGEAEKRQCGGDRWLP